MSFVSQFKAQAKVMAGDLRHRKIIRTALRNYEIVRDQRKASFQDWQGSALKTIHFPKKTSLTDGAQLI